MKKSLLSLILLGIVFTSLFIAGRSAAAQEIADDGKVKPEVLRQIQALEQEKESRTAAQKKIDSRLLYTIKMRRSEMIAEGIANLDTNLNVDEKGFIEVSITADVTTRLLKELKQIGAEIISSLPEYRSITARIPISEIEPLAEFNEIIFIMPREEGVPSGTTQPPVTSIINDFSAGNINSSLGFKERNQTMRDFVAAKIYDGLQPETGSVTSQGDTTHAANTFRATTGFNGTGIKIGVMSNGINTLAARQSSGDLPAITVISGQAGSGDEGTAMLEIVYDIAPGAQLYYATAATSSAQFAANIRALRTAGCNIIIDDYTYFYETPFQNGQAASVVSSTNGGVIIQAVNDVTVGSQAGALYFSSAANSGNKNDNTAGAWEGDFADGGAVTAPITGTGNLHNFGGATFDTLTTGGRTIVKWSDPLGGSGNDYDVFILDSAGTTVTASSTNVQTGTQDPLEDAGTRSTGEKIVIVKRTGAANRFLHLNTNRGRLSISTAGVIFGHNGGVNTVSLAATPSGPNVFSSGYPVGPFPGLFNSSNTVELFSSDGPRRIFYNADSTPLTPGNVSSTGGQLLQKPDLTAADGVSTTTPGFIPFYGTSAAAPHAGALAALLESACPASTNAQIVSAMKSTAIDIEAAGYDRDSGAGIIMPIPARTALCGSPTRKQFDFDGDGKADLSVFRPSNGTWYVQQSTAGFTGAAFGTNGDRIVPADYDGDGKTDYAVFRTGTWYLQRSTAGFTGVSFGLASDIPVPADFDGDGKADLAVFRPSSGAWYVQGSTAGFYGVTFGLNGDAPVPADYDGDGKADLAVFRPSNGTWYLQRSTAGFTGINFGLSGDKLVPADYDGDGKADLAVFRSGTWYLQQSTAGFAGISFGLSTDVPAPADFDGDGKTDIAVFRNGTWYLQRSTAGFTGVAFGTMNDIAVPAFTQQ